MADLTLTPNLDRPDDFYAELIAAHDGLSEDESAALNARLILILANQIGDTQIISAALKAASKPDR
ncbi:hypothetical protein ANTHELSMS3_02395 [Antarctobacter heliothermus]|uniref:DUF2783 domain-containing protein n=1 Tax=Antarctobacter heliothermus TaxID=74033 RepID=A0A222E506_9RHOB|nr:DUF2783 domain-containing protein [Antarctobacter heliothermus]ASP21068.1 hypothetical protein ANTHELSMS3_02395 [Antarctobacter heliothermus]MBT56671.1 DUF2783 domain-containing protein [Mameliella sp.]|tara:strand:+ start:2920 stop:3117 length:198 start_codon:yes stop_codon:yes gene_type:complete